MDYILSESKVACILRALMMNLGFTFEISRLDRNDYIEVYGNNILEVQKPAFD